jgi:hypothetical protein
LTFGQRPEPITLDCGEMNENILAAIGGRNETESLGFVEPFNSACRHLEYLQKKIKNSINRRSHRGIVQEVPCGTLIKPSGRATNLANHRSERAKMPVHSTVW